MAASKMGVEPYRCVVVKDSVPGMTAGMLLFVLQPEKIESNLPKQAKVISRLAELHDHIDLAD